MKAAVGIEYSYEGVVEEDRHLYTGNWDMHPFGAWIANEAAKHNHKPPYNVDEVVRKINVWKASNGEESLRLVHRLHSSMCRRS